LKRFIKALTSGENAEKLSGYPHSDGHGNGVEAALSGLRDGEATP
jgi:hypothetical protein